MPGNRLRIHRYSINHKANYITMKISPFEKATVANIKDIVLTMISVLYFKDLLLTPLSETGILICLIASVTFSIKLLDKN